MTAEQEPTRLTLSISAAARLLGISRASAYECARRGEIPVLKLGRRLVVPRAALERLLTGEAEAKSTIG